jgi:tRNA threonylcarbamoyladenosine biosynthesis protein TsaB
MLVLGIETSGAVAGLALRDELGVVAESSFRHQMRLSGELVPRIQRLLIDSGLSVGDLGGIAVCLGPGSFTSLRIGVTAAKTLAYAREIPIAGVGALDALAAAVPAPPRALLCCVLTASGDDIFAALFQWHQGRPEPRAEEMLLPARDLAARLGRSPLDVVLVGDPGPHRELLLEALGERIVAAPDDRGPRAGVVACLGRERLLIGAGDPVHELAPRYLRPSAAEARRAAVGADSCPG